MDEVNELKKKYPHLATLINASSKIWHRNFPCKITFDLSVKINEAWYWLGARYGFPIPGTHEKFRLRGGRSLTLYFETLEDTEAAIQHFNNRIQDIKVLSSDNTIKTLEDDRKLRLKKQLYFKQYRHKIRFNYKFDISEEKVLEIKKWVCEMFNIDTSASKRVRNNNVWFRWNQNEPTMFLNADEDLTLVKLAWGEYFNTIETIQLINKKELSR